MVPESTRYKSDSKCESNLIESSDRAVHGGRPDSKKGPRDTESEGVAKRWYLEKGWVYARVVLVYLPDGTTPVFAAVLAAFH